MEATLHDNRLVLDTGGVRRNFLWNDGALETELIESPENGRRWDFGGESGREKDVRVPGQPEAADGVFTSREVAQTPVREAHLEATVVARYGTVEVKRVFRLFEESPAIACEYYLRGTAPAGSFGEPVDHSISRIEDAAELDGGGASLFRLDRLIQKDLHYRADAVRFFDVTDRNNNLLRCASVLPYRSSLPLIANLLVLEETFRPGGMFVLKESPGPLAHHAYPGYDFLLQGRSIDALGIGLRPEDLDVKQWTRGYGLVVGVYDEDDEGGLLAIRAYQETLRRRIVDRDEMVLMNTWGDRGQDAKMSETFALAEIEACARLGVTRLQLDDGWQAGRSSNSAFEGGSLAGIWSNPDYWKPHPERFPRGLDPVSRRARELEVELCLWFNPSADGSYAHWHDDARTLLGLHREHGIRTFKIDGVMIPDKQAEVNLRRMLDEVMEGSDGAVVFNLDVTAGLRFGYFSFREYGNLFLENRYTDKASYYPHWTLRNLWMLARYVPPQSFQIEFLNIWRNRELYGDDDPLAPVAVPFEYCFAITMMAQPLAWFEGTGLPDAAFEIAPVIERYREHQYAIHSAVIFPVGEEPSGASWTGFQALGSGKDGYVEVFREKNERASTELHLRLEEGTTVRFEPVCGSGEVFDAVVGSSGAVTFALAAPFSYALYRYSVI